MAVLSIIVGILLIIAGISCVVTPILTFFAAGYVICAFLLIYGIVGIVRAFQKKAHPLEVVASILAVIVGIVVLVNPGGGEIFSGIVLYFLVAWLFVQGVCSIVISIQSRPSSGWVWGLIAGILAVILGIFFIIHPMVAAVTAGILVALLLVEAGISLIALATVSSEEE